jgi:putative membrane protein
MQGPYFKKEVFDLRMKELGVLFYFTEFEKRVEIIPDRGAYTMVPDDYWTQFENGFQTIFNEHNLADAFIKELNKTKNVFSEFILPVENDINELPDDLEIEI